MAAAGRMRMRLRWHVACGDCMEIPALLPANRKARQAAAPCGQWLSRAHGDGGGLGGMVNCVGGKHSCDAARTHVFSGVPSKSSHGLAALFPGSLGSTCCRCCRTQRSSQACCVSMHGDQLHLHLCTFSCHTRALLLTPAPDATADC
jgi:hypothetical protein